MKLKNFLFYLFVTAFVLGVIFLIFFIFIAVRGKLSISIPSYFIRCEEYFEPDAFMDSIDYCKYYYNDSAADAFFSDKKFIKTDEDDLAVLAEILKGFEDFAMLHEHLSAYDFDRDTQLKKGDCYCLVTKEGINKGKWGDEHGTFYDLYYFDAAKNILYYFHVDT